MDDRLDPTEKPVEPIGQMTFEGIPVTGFEGMIPSTRLEMPDGGYPIGSHMRFTVEVRVANVRYEEGRGKQRAEFIRRHVFVTESVTLEAAFIPGEAASAPIGNVAGSEGLDDELEDLTEGQVPVDVGF